MPPLPPVPPRLLRLCKKIINCQQVWKQGGVWVQNNVLCSSPQWMFLQRSWPISILGFFEALCNERKLPCYILHLALNAVLMTVCELRHFSFHTFNLSTKSYPRRCYCYCTGDDVFISEVRHLYNQTWASITARDEVEGCCRPRAWYRCRYEDSRVITSLSYDRTRLNR